ncbi:MAG TPA: hypothetical protein VMU01_11970 [Rhizomicrobium sp.]|nr:hypothetical protein [Rhizomicrobium sp.]
MCDMEDEELPKSAPSPSLTPWALCVAVLLGPALLVWVVRAFAFAAGCEPGPAACQGVPLGAGLRDALALDWAISTSALLLVGLSIIATLFAFRACRPLLGTLTLLLLPILAPVLPMIAVLMSRYEDCPVSTDGIGSCQLWGASMGMTFHKAAIAPDFVYGVVPYTVALTFMLGLLGFFFARPRPSAPPTPMEQMRRMTDGHNFDQ